MLVESGKKTVFDQDIVTKQFTEANTVLNKHKKSN